MKNIFFFRRCHVPRNALEKPMEFERAFISISQRDYNV